MHDATVILAVLGGFPLLLGAALWLLCRWESWLLPDDLVSKAHRAIEEAAEPVPAPAADAPTAHAAAGSGVRPN
jgi:hypothetical protein